MACDRFCMLILCIVLYEQLKSFAKQSAEEARNGKCNDDELQQKNADLKAATRKHARTQPKCSRKEQSHFMQSVLKKQKEVELRHQTSQQKCSRMLKKSQETAEIKVQQLQKENSKLQSDLNAGKTTCETACQKDRY